MAWIESHQHLDKNGKVLELANRLHINRYQAIGHLHALWWWALDNAEDGNLVRFSYATVTQACGWSDYIKDEDDLSQHNEITNRDAQDELVPALIECGFLDKETDGLWIHNWRVYTARYFSTVKSLKRLRETAKIRMRRLRKRDASVTHPLRHVTAPTLPNQTLPNLTNNKDSKYHSRAKAPGDPRVSELIKDFYTRLEAKLGEKPAAFNGGAAGKIFAHQLKVYSPEEITARMGAWFDSTDPFIVKNSYRVEWFKTNFNALKGGPLHANTKPSGGYIGAPPVPGKYADNVNRPKQAATEPE